MITSLLSYQQLQIETVQNYIKITTTCCGVLTPSSGSLQNTGTCRTNVNANFTLLYVHLSV